jgi:hypothetical protein
MVEDRLPQWEIGRQVAPGTAGTQDVEDRVENGTQRMGWWSASFRQGRQKALQACPLDIGQATRIRCTHRFSLSHVGSSSLSRKHGEAAPEHVQS